MILDYSSVTGVLFAILTWQEHLSFLFLWLNQTTKAERESSFCFFRSLCSLFPFLLRQFLLLPLALQPSNRKQRSIVLWGKPDQNHTFFLIWELFTFQRHGWYKLCREVPIAIWVFCERASDALLHDAGTQTSWLASHHGKLCRYFPLF